VRDQRSTTGKQRYPAIRGRVIFDTWRGVQRVRAWPRARGPSTSGQVLRQNDWFKAANRMAMIVEPRQMATAIEVTKNTGLYPRDLLVRTMKNGIFDIVEADGTLITTRPRRLDPVSFQGAICRPASPVSCPIGVATYLTWELPQVDTLGFWNVANPTRLTVPEGVTEMEFHAGAVLNSSATTYMIAIIRINRLLTKAYTRVGNSARVSQTLSSGPCQVTEGDYCEVNVQIGSVGSLLASGYTFFGCQVIGTI